MTNPTANRSYDMPQSIDLVTNLPADFATFGDAVDLDMVTGGGYQTVATAAGTTVLTKTSARVTFFTGVTTQTVTLPVVSTLALGSRFKIVNKSTGIVTVQSSGANTVYAVPAGASAIFTCILITGATAASWDYYWDGTTAAPASGSLTLLSTTSLSGTTTTVSSISGSYKKLLVYVYGSDKAHDIRLNASAVLFYGIVHYTLGGTAYQASINAGSMRSGYGDPQNGSTGAYVIEIMDYAGATNWKAVNLVGGFVGNSYTQIPLHQAGMQKDTSAISSISFVSDGGSFTAGTILIYGVN